MTIVLNENNARRKEIAISHENFGDATLDLGRCALPSPDGDVKAPKWTPRLHVEKIEWKPFKLMTAKGDQHSIYRKKNSLIKDMKNTDQNLNILQEKIIINLYVTQKNFHVYFPKIT